MKNFLRITMIYLAAFTGVTQAGDQVSLPSLAGAKEFEQQPGVLKLDFVMKISGDSFEVKYTLFESVGFWDSAGSSSEWKRADRGELVGKVTPLNGSTRAFSVGGVGILTLDSESNAKIFTFLPGGFNLTRFDMSWIEGQTLSLREF